MRVQAFVYAPMSLKGECIKAYPQEAHPIPKADMVIGEEEPWTGPDNVWAQTGFGEIRRGDQTGAFGRWLYKMHDVVLVHGGIAGPHAWYLVMEPQVCAKELSPRGDRDVPGAEGMKLDLKERGTVGINLMPDFEINRRETRPSIFLGSWWEYNHYHYILDTLTMGWAQDEGLVPPDVIPHDNETTAVHYQALYVPSAWPPLGYCPGVVEWLRDSYRFIGPRKDKLALILTRRDAKNARRRVTNEPDVLDALISLGLGVRAIEMGSLDFDEQLRLVAKAGWIIGPHGAAMTNTIFANNAKVIEFVPSRYQHPVFQYLNKWAGNTYGRIICEGDHQSNMTVDIEALKMMVKALA